ncbi:hypothetical protein FO519_007951 [Halicephalobus sp. NKZ332]|nr:hypothetical protein FO519_007951 [Halicephalobus sp. NKZ332]
MATDEEEMKTFQDLLEEKEALKAKMALDCLDYKDSIIYCKKAMQIQDDEVKRLEEMVEMNEKFHKEKLALSQKENMENVENLKKELKRMKGEHLLMTTQIGNQQQLELEMTEMQKVVESLKKELSKKEEKMNLREIREREIALMTEKKVREQVQKEFDSEISKIARQLKIQNAAQIEANHHNLRKMTLEKHSDQNQKLKDLQEFLKIVLEDNDDDYIDTMLGENRIAIFAKLSMLLQRIPIVQ